MEGEERALELGEAPHFCDGEQGQSFLVPGEYFKRYSARFLKLYFIWRYLGLYQPLFQPSNAM